MNDQPLSINTQGLNTDPTAYNPNPQAYGAPQPKGNWLERLLPTAGGVLGGIAGSFVTPVLGSGVGAGLGSALGQELEDKLTGDKQSVLSTGLENAAGGLAGGELGKIAGGVLGKVGNIAANNSSKLFAGQGPGIGKELADYVTQKLGINDLKQASDLGEIISGNPDQEVNPGKGLVSNFISDAANGDKSKVDLSNLMPATPGTSKAALQSQSSAAIRNIESENPLLTEKLISDNGLAQGDADAIRKQISGVIGRPDNLASASKSEVLGMQKQIASMASQARQAAIRSGSSADTAKANVLRGVDQQLRGALGFDTMKVDPDEARMLGEDIVANAPAESKKAAQVIASDITNQAASEQGLSVADLRNMESNWVQLQGSHQDMLRLADKNFGTSTADMTRSTLPIAGAVTGMGGPKSVLGTATGLLANHPSADKTLSTGLSKLSGVTRGTVAKILPRAIQASAIAGANLPNIASSLPQSTQPSQNVNMESAMNNPQNSPLEEAFQIALAGAGVNPNSAALLSALAQPAQKLQMAAPVLSKLLPSYEAAGGAQGFGGGLLSELTSFVSGSPANQYARQQSAASGVISQLLGITPQQAGQLTPQLMQTPTTSTIPAGNVSSILGTL